MPKYVYECTECKEILELRHSIKERAEDCTICGTEGALIRIPSVPMVIKRKSAKAGHKPGHLIKDFIESTREEIKSEKNDLKNRDYKE